MADTHLNAYEAEAKATEKEAEEALKRHEEAKARLHAKRVEVGLEEAPKVEENEQTEEKQDEKKEPQYR